MANPYHDVKGRFTSADNDHAADAVMDQAYKIRAAAVGAGEARASAIYRSADRVAGMATRIKAGVGSVKDYDRAIRALREMAAVTHDKTLSNNALARARSMERKLFEL